MPRGPDLCTLATSGQIRVRDPSASAGAKALTAHNDDTWKSRGACFVSRRAVGGGCPTSPEGQDQGRLHFEIQSQGASGLICTPFQSKQA